MVQYIKVNPQCIVISFIIKEFIEVTQIYHLYKYFVYISGSLTHCGTCMGFINLLFINLFNLNIVNRLAREIKCHLNFILQVFMSAIKTRYTVFCIVI